MLTFGYYLKKGGNNSKRIHDTLIKTRQHIVTMASQKQIIGKNTLQEFQDDLNILFYNKENNSQYQNIINQLNQSVAAAYQQESGKILADFNITDSNYALINIDAFGSDFMQQVEQLQKKIERTNISFKVAIRYIKIVNESIDAIINKSQQGIKILETNKDIKRIKERLIPTLQEEILSAFQAAGYQNDNNFLSRWLMTSKTGMSKNWLHAFKELEAIVIALTTNNGKTLLTTQEYGETLELATSELHKVINKTVPQTEDKLLQRLMGDAKKVGQSSVSRGGAHLDMVIDKKYLGDTSYRGVWDSKTNTWKTNKNGQKIIQKYVYINTDPKLEIKYTEEQDEFDTKGKVDVILEYGENNNKLRISEKNFGYNVSERNNFGETNLLAGLNRSLNNKILLESYTMALQYPYTNSNGKVYEEASSRLQAAHNLAKIALVADILMGYSQEQGYANCLLVHQRGRKFTVIDIIELIKKLNNNLAELQPSKMIGNETGFEEVKYIQLEGYNANLLEDAAQSIRTMILKSNSASLNTQNYYSIMYNYLKTQQIILKAKLQDFND